MSTATSPPVRIDPAEHLRLVKYVMRLCRVRERLQAADADDVESDLYAILLAVARSYRPEVGTFANYAVASMAPRAWAGDARENKRFRRRRHVLRRLVLVVRPDVPWWAREYEQRREVVERRMILFSEFGPWFADWWKYMATEPPAGDLAEAADQLTADRAEVRLLLRRLHPRSRLALEARYGVGRYQESGPMTLAELGKLIGVTRERARQIIANAELKLRPKAEVK